MKHIILESGKASKKDKWLEAVEENKWFIDELGDYISDYWLGSKSWLNSKQSYNEFKIYLYQRLWKSIFDKDYEPNWENRLSAKNYIYYDTDIKEWDTTRNYSVKYNMQVYVSSMKKARQMLDDLKRVGVIK